LRKWSPGREYTDELGFLRENLHRSKGLVLPMATKDYGSAPELRPMLPRGEYVGTDMQAEDGGVTAARDERGRGWGFAQLTVAEHHNPVQELHPCFVVRSIGTTDRVLLVGLTVSEHRL
jgi:hypothetical protein